MGAEEWLDTPGAEGNNRATLSAFKQTPMPASALSRKRPGAELATPLGAKKTVASPTTPIGATAGDALASPSGPNPLDVRGSAFKAREKKGLVSFTLNAHVAPAAQDETPTDEPSRAPLHYPLGGQAPLSEDVRYMAEDTRDRALFLEERMRRVHATLARAATRADNEALDGSFSVACVAPESVTVVGRVMGDFLSEGTRLNEASVLLEGSNQASKGHQVRLDLEGAAEYSIFPGQVLALEGNNPSGSVFRAQRVLPVRPAAPAPVAGEADASACDRPAPLSVLIASGPFTSDEDLGYEPLEELLATVAERRPDLVILCGPFLSEDHPLLLHPNLEQSYETIYEQRVRDQILNFLRADEERGELRRPTFAILPSAKDLHAEPVHPQPPLPRDEETHEEDAMGQLFFLPSPATFRVHGVVIAATTADVLFDLSAHEIARGQPQGSDRLARLAGHLVQQRSFYPVFPPSRTCPMDYSLRDHLVMPVEPQLLITPSKLATFAKIASVPAEEVGGKPSKVVCVNPGAVARGKGGGTFAMVHFNPQEGTELAECTRVEIIHV